MSDSTAAVEREGLLAAAQSGDLLKVHRLLCAGGYDGTLKEAIEATLDNVEMVVLLMDHVKGGGVWPDVLRAASRAGAVPTLEMLLQLAEDANVTARDPAGWSLLHIAAMGGDVATLQPIATRFKRLSTTLIDLTAQKHKVSPLWVAASCGGAEAVAALADAKADVDLAACDGSTPLHVAALKGHQSVVATLLAAGANPEQATAKGTLPLHVALKKGHRETAKALVGAKRKRPSEEEAEAGEQVKEGAEGVQSLLVEIEGLRGSAEGFNAELRRAHKRAGRGK